MGDTAGNIDVPIRADLYERIEQRVGESEFDDAGEYVEFVLEELLEQLEGPSTESQDRDEEVRDRLKELGYLE